MYIFGSVNECVSVFITLRSCDKGGATDTENRRRFLKGALIAVRAGYICWVYL